MSGTLNGSVAWVAGRPSPSIYSLSFPGDLDSHVNFGAVDWFSGPNGFTIFMSMKVADPWSYDGGTDFSRFILGKAQGFFLDNEVEFMIYISLDDVVTEYQRLELNIGSGLPSYLARRTASNVPINQWFTFAVTYDPTSETIHMYLNGAVDEDIQTGNEFAGVPANVYDLRIGSIPRASSGVWFQGEMEYVFIWQRALTASEIATVHADPFGSVS